VRSKPTTSACSLQALLSLEWSFEGRSAYSALPGKPLEATIPVSSATGSSLVQDNV
jgi:hypothetical protein